jgi:uncharacterized membrane protein YcjF (UPF0283 family)
MRAHLRQVGWWTIAADLLTAVVAAAVSAWVLTLDTDTFQHRQWISGGALGYAFLLLGGCVWELVLPDAKSNDGVVAYLSSQNDRLHNENADLAAQGDHLQDRVDKLEDENADLNGRIQDLADQLTGAEA